MSSYGNMPAPLAQYRTRRRRRRRAAGALAVGGTAALFGTRGGRRMLGSGLKALGRRAPGARRIAARGLQKTFRAGRTVGNFGRSQAASLFRSSMRSFPTQTKAVARFGKRAGAWLGGLKAAFKAF